MTRKRLATVFLVVAALSGLVLSALAQEERSQTSQDRLTGKVQKIDKERSTIEVAFDNIQRQVVYNDQTRFTELNKPGSLDHVREGRLVICRGKFDGKNRLVAARIEVRDQ